MLLQEDKDMQNEILQVRIHHFTFYIFLHLGILKSHYLNESLSVNSATYYSHLVMNEVSKLAQNPSIHTCAGPMFQHP